MTNKSRVFIFLLFIIISGFLYSQTSGITGDSQINKCETKAYTISIQNTSGNPIDNIVVTAHLVNLPGFSYVSGTTSIDVNGSAFCSADPSQSGTNLIWDIDLNCGGPFTLNNGETLNVTFSLETDCTAVSGSLNATINYEISGTSFSDDTGVLSIEVFPGAVTIKKRPNVIPQEVGQDVTWTLTIENTGLGIIENVVVTDVLGNGLQYVSSSPPGTASGQTITWSSTEIPVFSSMNPGDTVNIDITATVISCVDLGDTADVRWGCDLVTACYNTSVDGGTATASVERIVKTPLLDFSAPDVNFNYCEDYFDVSFTISNIGDGAARNVFLYPVSFGPLLVSDVSSGAIYNTVEGRFEFLDPIPSGGSYNLSFRLNYSDWCSSSFPSGEIIWQTRYEDVCGNEFFPPVELSNMNSPASSTSISVSKTGAGEAIQINEQVTYNITSSYSGPLTCGAGGSVSDVTVVDTIPDGFTVVDAGGGTYVPGAGGTGGTITWTYIPPSSLNTSITLQAPGRDECETYCFTYFTNSVDASVTDCCGCSLTNSASQSTAIECEELVDSEKTANPSTGIRCDTIVYTNTYDFTSSATVPFNTLSFEEHADNQQEYVPGSLSVNFDGSDITGCISVTDNTPGGYLELDFSSCTNAPVTDKNLTIIYELSITENTSPACSETSFYSWSSLDMGTSGNECLQDGIINETTTISVEPPSMSVSVSGLGEIVHKCQTKTITINLSQTSNNADPKDVKLVLSGVNYYVINPAATVCSGVAPTSCTPSIVGDDYVWEFGDAFTGSGQTATLQLDVQKRCTGSGNLVATAYYDDNCNDDSTYDEICSTTGLDDPALLLSGDLLVEKNPEVYYADTNTVGWKIYLTNRGNGNTYNVWLDDILGSGLDYNNATVDDMTGVTITADQDHEGNSINGATIQIDQMDPGEKRTITFTADLLNCENLTNDVSTSWGCIGLECEGVINDNSIVEIPAPLLTNTNNITTPIDMCSTADGSIILKNSGQTTVYNLQTTVNLPSGLNYVSGSTRWRINSGTWNGPDLAYDPSISGTPEQLDWTSSEIPGLTNLDPGDRIEIEYELETDCIFTGGAVTVSTDYENPCGNEFNTEPSNFTVNLNEPSITITKTRANEPIDCGELVEWTIEVTNNSDYALPIIWIQDTLGAAFAYDSYSWSAPYSGIPVDVDGQTLTWELTNLGSGNTATLTLRATSDSAPCSDDLDNYVVAYWGCGTPDGDPSTRPGIDEPDTCLTATGESETRTETRQPSVGYLNIDLIPDEINACDDNSDLTVVIQNTGPTDATNLDLVINLPAGLSYNLGTSALYVGTDSSGSTSPIGDPVVSGNQLIYYNIGDTGNNIADTLEADGGNDTLVLEFSVRSDCYVTADLDFNIYYYDCCGNNQWSTDTSENLGALYPELLITKVPVSSQVDCNEVQEWTITVTNNGAGQAEVVVIEDTLGDWIGYVGSNPAATSMGGSTYGWEINNLAGSGGSQTFTIQGRLNPDAPQSNCAEILRQNNVRTRWACGTSGDAVDGDPNTNSDYDCSYTSWADATPALLQMPNLVITNITPLITCNSDGSFSGSISVRVENQGDGDSTTDFTVQITDGKGWTGTGTYSGTIAPGNYVDVTIDTNTWVPDCHDCVSPYIFNATVDLNDDVCECDESDNDFGPLTYTAPIPELTVTDIDFTNVSCTNDNISGTVDVTIRNNGCVTANNVEVSLETDGCLSFSIETINSLASETSTIVSFSINGSWNDCTSQDCQFTATVDPNDNICECDGTNNTRTESYSTTLSDLIVTDIDFSNITCSNDNISGSVLITIQNQGYGSPNNFQVGLSTDGCLNFTDQSVTDTLNNGDSTTVTFNINDTWTGCDDCDCLFTATVDVDNDICECDGTNNQLTDTYTTILPDLRVNSVTPAANCLSDNNQSGAVTVNVDNNGCGDANGVVVRLTSDCGISFSDQTINLTQGSNTNLTFNYTPDSSPCECTFTAEIDPDNNICECTDTNNSDSSTFTPDIPDITVNNDSLTATCFDDGTVNVSGTVTLQNDGCGAALTDNIPMRFTLYDNTGCGGNQIDQWTQTFSSVNIASGGGTQVFTINSRTITTNLCENSTGCQFSIFVEADYSDAICEWDGTNNTYCADNKDVNIPDIEVSSDTLDVSCYDDNQFSVSGNITLANNGCGNNLIDNIPVRFTVYDNTGGSGTQIDQWTQTFSGVNIAANGGTQSFTITQRNITANICENSTSCQISIEVEVDYNDSICECDGTDNSYTSDKSVDIPDIEVSGENINISCLDDGQIQLSGTFDLANNGCGSNLNENIPVRFTLYDNTGCSGNQINQWTETFSGVNIAANGGTQSFNIPLHNTITDICNNATSCQVSLQIEADPNDTICECDGTDNSLCSSKNISIPDLQVDNVATTVTCLDDGDLVGTTVTVSNTGCGDITGAVVRLTSDCGLTFSDQTVDLNAGETKDVLFNFTSGITTCDCNFTAEIDPDNNICECSSANNIGISTDSMIISDIEVQSETLSVICANDNEISVQGNLTVINNGCGPALTNDIPIRFTLYSNSGCGGNIIEQWTETLSGVNISSEGGTQTFTVSTHNIITNLCDTDCEVSVFVELDYPDQICEWDGTDNTYCSDIIYDCIDLEPSDLNISTVCTRDNEISGTATLTVNNSGNTPVNNDFIITFEDGEGEIYELFFNADLNGTLPLNPNSSSTVEFDWERVFNDRPYICNFENITVSLDSDGDVCECDSENNIINTSYTLPYPDINIQDMNVECSTDENLRLEMIVSNDGCSNVNSNFEIEITDSNGYSRTFLFTELGGTLPLVPGNPQTLYYNDWPFDCEDTSLGFSISIDSRAQICELSSANNFFETQFNINQPDLLFNNIDWECNPDGSISFNINIANKGNTEAINGFLTIYDENNNSIYNNSFNLSAGENKIMTFVTPPYTQDVEHSFRFVLDELDNICECDGSNNEANLKLSCSSTEGPQLIIDKICSRAQQPGGIYSYQLIIKNISEVDINNVIIYDILPDNFQYVEGTSVLGNSRISDPISVKKLSWNIGNLSAGEETTLKYQAIAPADTDPGRYCNEAWGEGIYPSGNKVISEKSSCCTVLRREITGCCLRIEQTFKGSIKKPETPISFINPYFPTEDAMFTVYSMLHFWENVETTNHSMENFIKERLKNYSLETMEEFYTRSKMGIASSDGNIWLSYAGAYPEKDTDRIKWEEKRVNKTMTLSQLGFELLALNKTINIEKRDQLKNTYKNIVNKKLEFLFNNIDNPAHEWKIKDNSIEKGREKATFYDLSVLFLALENLKSSGFKVEDSIINKVYKQLKTIDDNEFDNKIKEQLFYILALNEAGYTNVAKEKISKFEELYNNGSIKLNSLTLFALSSYVDNKLNGSIYPSLNKKMQNKFYLEKTNIFAESQADFTHKLKLENLASLVLSFEHRLSENPDFFASTFYRMIEETGLFLNKRNIQVPTPLVNLIKNYPFSQEMIPMLSFIKGNEKLASVFSEEAVIHSPKVNPLGENLFPYNYVKIFSPSYEINSSEIFYLTYILQNMSKSLMNKPDQLIIEKGRTLSETSKSYIDSILSSNAGLETENTLLVPFDELAIRGSKKKNPVLEPLTSNNVFSTKTLADFMLAEVEYLKSKGLNNDIIKNSINFQKQIIKIFENKGYIPKNFSIILASKISDVKVLHSEEKADKITLAKLYSLLKSEFLKNELKKDIEAPNKITPDDMIFLFMNPEIADYFSKEIAAMKKETKNQVTYLAAQILANRLKNKENNELLNNLEKLWEKDVSLPKSDRLFKEKETLIVKYEPFDFILYLLATDNISDLKYRRVLNYFTYLIENEWGIIKSQKNMVIPPSEYWLVKESPRQQPEVGDLLTFNVKLENRCPNSLARALDLPSVFIETEFFPPLFYAGTQYFENIKVLDDFLWFYERLKEGQLLDYDYQVIIPDEFEDNILTGNIRARGYTGYQGIDPEAAFGDFCEEWSTIKRLPVLPLKKIKVIVYEDRNANGRKDAGENGVPGILLRDTLAHLFRTNTQGEAFIPAGSQTIGVQIDLKSVDEKYLITTSPTRIINREFDEILSFGLTPCINLKGIVFEDINNNSLIDDNEQKLQGIVIEAKEKKTITNGNGIFTFRNLPVIWKKSVKISSNQIFVKQIPDNAKFKLIEEKTTGEK